MKLDSCLMFICIDKRKKTEGSENELNEIKTARRIDD